MNCFAIDVVKIISAKEMIICELDTLNEQIKNRMKRA